MFCNRKRVTQKCNLTNSVKTTVLYVILVRQMNCNVVERVHRSVFKNTLSMRHISHAYLNTRVVIVVTPSNNNMICIQLNFIFYVFPST